MTEPGSRLKVGLAATQGSTSSIPRPVPAITCAIIVAYNPDREFERRISTVTWQFPRVFIVDNASGAEAQSMLQTLALDPKVQLVLNPENLGIAQALNQGLAHALEDGFSWCVTLDQDTVVFDDMLEVLISVYFDCGHEKVLVGGNYLNVNKQKNFIDCGGGDKSFRERKTLITAGTLVPVREALQMGGFRGDYFIDSVDHEFCLRARDNGFRVVISCKPVMSQSIGSKMEVTSWLSRFASFNHSPIRKYYIARNTLVTARDYCLREPAWAARQAWRLVSDFASILLFESEKFTKAKSFLKGILHGLAGKMGRLPGTH